MEFIDDSSQDIQLTNVDDWMQFNKGVESTSNDPFNVEEEELKKVRGLSPTFRRKMSREFQKKFEGLDGAKTQQNLLAQAITGYAMFDLIQPPYNLEYLSRIYEISPYNYAEIGRAHV